MAAHLLDAPLAPLPSSLADLRDVPLAKLLEGGRAGLGETLDRVLPSADVPGVQVAAFNSALMIALAAMLLLRRPARGYKPEAE